MNPASNRIGIFDFISIFSQPNSTGIFMLGCVLDVATGPRALRLKLEIQAKLCGFPYLYLSLYQSTNVMCNLR